MDFGDVGDRAGVKGLYLMNLVDPDRSRSAITQYESVGAVVGISARFLVLLLEGLLLSFPFPILGFHADNASVWRNSVSTLRIMATCSAAWRAEAFQ